MPTEEFESGKNKKESHKNVKRVITVEKVAPYNPHFL